MTQPPPEPLEVQAVYDPDPQLPPDDVEAIKQRILDRMIQAGIKKPRQENQP